MTQHRARQGAPVSFCPNVFRLLQLLPLLLPVNHLRSTVSWSYLVVMYYAKYLADTKVSRQTTCRPLRTSEDILRMVGYLT